MEYYSALEKKLILDIMWSATSQSQKDEYSMIPLIGVS